MNGIKDYSYMPIDLIQSLQLCGPGRLLVTGCETARLVKTLAMRGYDVHGIDEGMDETADLDSDRLGNGTIVTMPFSDQAFDTVCVENGFQLLEESAVVGAFSECYRVTRRYTVVVVPTDRLRGRVWWESKAFLAGFRRHTCFLALVPYEVLEDERGFVVLLLEKLPGASFVSYPLERLLPERELHMDMLRESGRRADAHLVRYSYFRHLVNAGDTVLDVACGLGYGSAALWDATLAARVVGVDNSESAICYARDTYSPCRSGLEYVNADAANLGFLADGSIDVVLSFETVEHVEDPLAFLAEVRRVLKPTGRFICSVPNMWVDETGTDIGSYHLHSFGYQQIMILCRKFFTVEQVFAQNAGGGYKFSEHGRMMRKLDPMNDHSTVDAEWWLMVCRKPLSGKEMEVANSLPGENQRTTLLPLLRKRIFPFFFNSLNRLLR